MAATPMMQQYLDAKNACGDALLFFRMGDFYELFYDDARTAARVLGLTLTSRDKGENPIPMAGFPYHQLESYLAKLIANGHRAAVCEQVEDPKLAKGLVKREVTRVVSPGTLTDDALLDPRESNYLAAVALPAHKSNGDSTAGIAWVELSTGRFFAATFRSPASPTNSPASLRPNACSPKSDTAILALAAICPSPARTMLTAPSRLVVRLRHGTRLAPEALRASPRSTVSASRMPTPRPAGRWRGARLPARNAEDIARPHRSARRPTAAAICSKSTKPRRRSLEITRTMRDGRPRRLAACAIDRQTVTPMGARLLAEWIANPLTNLAAIQARLDAVSELLHEDALLAKPCRATSRRLRPGTAPLPRGDGPGQSARFAASSAARSRRCRR